MAVIELTKDNFEQIVSDNDIVVIDFWAPWCGPCRSFAPTFEKVSEENEDVVFAKVNTEQEQEIAVQFNIRSIPTLAVFREQIILFMEAGAPPESGLVELVSNAQKVDMAMVREEIAKAEADKKEAYIAIPE